MIPATSHALFGAVVESGEHFVLVTHINPDGDALGSQVSLAAFLGTRGKQVRIVNHDPVPSALGFLVTTGPVPEVYRPDEHDAVLQAADRIILVDNSVPDRLGSLEPALLAAAARTLCIDHHPSRDAPWCEAILDREACATTVMIYDLVRGCGWTPTLAAAEAIYVGLTTDTGFFRFNSTNARAHEVAADLLRLGVSPADAFQRVYERNSEAFTRLLGHALSGLKVSGGGAVASVEVTRGLTERLQATDVETSEILTALLAMDGIRIAALFRELPAGKVKVSLRSKGDLDVHRLAGEFGGGGHRNASGIVISGTLGEVALLLIDRTDALVRRPPGD